MVYLCSLQSTKMFVFFLFLILSFTVEVKWNPGYEIKMSVFTQVPGPMLARVDGFLFCPPLPPPSICKI